MASSRLTKSEAIALLNRLANEPANLRSLGYTWLDLSAFFERPGNVALGDEHGVMLFCEVEPDVYEGHYLFGGNARGRDALRQARAMVTHMFTLRGAFAIFGDVPVQHRAARLFTCALGFTPVGASVDSQGRSCVTYRMERSQWATLSVQA